MSTSPTDPAGDESYSAPSSDDEHEHDDAGTRDGGAETGTPFASGGGTDDAGAVTDEPRERDEPQRSE